METSSLTLTVVYSHSEFHLTPEPLAFLVFSVLAWFLSKIFLVGRSLTSIWPVLFIIRMKCCSRLFLKSLLGLFFFINKHYQFHASLTILGNICLATQSRDMLWTKFFLCWPDPDMRLNKVLFFNIMSFHLFCLMVHLMALVGPISYKGKRLGFE